MQRESQKGIELLEEEMGTIPLRIDKEFVDQVSREAKIQNRSRTKQLVHWAKAGQIILSKMDITDLYAVSQGIKKLKLENGQSIKIKTKDILDALEKDRASGDLSGSVTSAKIYYEASVDHPGYLDRVNSVTGKRESGSFHNGEFKVL